MESGIFTSSGIFILFHSFYLFLILLTLSYWFKCIFILPYGPLLHHFQLLGKQDGLFLSWKKKMLPWENTSPKLPSLFWEIGVYLFILVRQITSFSHKIGCTSECTQKRPKGFNCAKGKIWACWSDVGAVQNVSVNGAIPKGCKYIGRWRFTYLPASRYIQTFHCREVPVLLLPSALCWLQVQIWKSHLLEMLDFTVACL